MPLAAWVRLLWCGAIVATVGAQTSMCENIESCKLLRSISNGVCDDGGPGSDFAVCDYGTDCADCGPRELSKAPLPPPPLSPPPYDGFDGSFLVGPVIFGLLVSAFCWVFTWRAKVIKKKCQVPSDAMPLTGGDAERYRVDFQGKWHMMRPSCQDYLRMGVIDEIALHVLGMHIMCDDLEVSGSHMFRIHLTNKGNAFRTSRELVFHRGGGDTLYIDRIGTKATKWDPANNEIVLQNALGLEVTLRRVGGGASGGGGGGAEGGGDLAAQLTSLAQLHSTGVLSDIEFEAAKAKLVGGGGGVCTPIVAATATPVSLEMPTASLVSNSGAMTGAASAGQTRAV